MSVVTLKLYHEDGEVHQENTEIKMNIPAQNEENEIFEDCLSINTEYYGENTESCLRLTKKGFEKMIEFYNAHKHLLPDEK